MFKFEGTGSRSYMSYGRETTWEIPVTVYAETAEDAHLKIQNLWTEHSNIESAISRAEELFPVSEQKTEPIVIEVSARTRGTSVKPLTKVRVHRF